MSSAGSITMNDTVGAWVVDFSMRSRKASIADDRTAVNMPPVKPTKSFERQPQFPTARTRAGTLAREAPLDGADTTLVRARSTPAKRWLFDLRSQKRVFVGQSALWECAERKGLRIAQPGAAADRIVDANQQVPQLVQLTCVLRLVAGGDMASLDLQVANPL